MATRSATPPEASRRRKPRSRGSRPGTRTSFRSITRCSIASRMCYVNCCSRLRPTWAAAFTIFSRHGGLAGASSVWAWPSAAMCWIYSPRAPVRSSIAGSSPNRSRLRWASIRSSAISPAPIRPARVTCCCITCSARSTASAGNGATHSGAWEQLRKRWRRRQSRAARRSTLTPRCHEC